MALTGRLILASKSPRRAQLLRDAGYAFQQVQPSYVEPEPSNADPVVGTVAVLARLKAESVLPRDAAEIILGCDTLLEVEGRPVGKPNDPGSARRILESLLDRPHKVYTAFYLVTGNNKPLAHHCVTASVTIHHPGAEELERYIASGQWRGKAGGYNLAELSGRWRFDVSGDPTTVIGLPMQELAEALNRFAPHIRPLA